MAKKHSKLKPKKRVRHPRITNSIVGVIKEDLKLLDKALDLTTTTLDEKRLAKKKFIKNINDRVLQDYAFLTQTTCLSEYKVNKEYWIEKYTKYIFWIIFLGYLKNNKVKSEYRIYFFKYIFEKLINLNDENLSFLINRDVFKEKRFQVNNVICKTDFINYFRLPKNLFIK